MPLGGGNAILSYIRKCNYLFIGDLGRVDGKNQFANVTIFFF